MDTGFEFETRPSVQNEIHNDNLVCCVPSFFNLFSLDVSKWYLKKLTKVWPTIVLEFPCVWCSNWELRLTAPLYKTVFKLILLTSETLNEMQAWTRWFVSTQSNIIPLFSFQSCRKKINLIKSKIGPSGVLALPLGVAAEWSVHYIANPKAWQKPKPKPGCWVLYSL